MSRVGLYCFLRFAGILSSPRVDIAVASRYFFGSLAEGFVLYLAALWLGLEPFFGAKTNKRGKKLSVVLPCVFSHIVNKTVLLLEHYRTNYLCADFIAAIGPTGNEAVWARLGVVLAHTTERHGLSATVPAWDLRARTPLGLVLDDMFSLMGDRGVGRRSGGGTAGRHI